jgi:PAS domain S-box-containing protein
MDLSEYVFEALRKDEEFILYRGQSKGVASQVLLLLPFAEYPKADRLKRLENEYSLKEELDPSWAARPIGIATHWDRMVLVLQDPGGVPLEYLLHPSPDASAKSNTGGQPLEVALALRLAISISAAIGAFHQRGIIHKDIKPANILADSTTGQCWLTGFGIASRLPRERQPPALPEFIAGTLSYMAPEQTGRMNRSIDPRSDLYALGVTLYEMLTGRLPFSAADPMEWVHCHIARKPVPPDIRSKTVPASLSAIVVKLLAKTAEERYQTAAGLENDLRRCLDEREGLGPRDPFPLGEHDTPDRLRIPEKLYGREQEIDTLLASFDRIMANGRPELVLVSGYSGIGKSSVVNELHKVLVPPRGLFASGKFDQYKRNIPYSTLAQAFQSLVRPLLAKSEAELRHWRDALREALGPNGLLMVDLVPELKPIVGEQPPVPDLPPQDAKARFQLVFRRFVGVFARSEHPLALFLDDLQWLDAATLDFLEDLLSQPDVHHLMLIGAYRDNEVDSTHPLWRKLDAIRTAGARLHELVLAPLTSEDLVLVLVDTLHCEPERATPLAHLVHEKTAGNPFFAIQFISALAEEGLLTFNHGVGKWSWDVGRIHGKGYTENVVDLMVWKLNRLPVGTQKALQEFACLGNRATISTLSIVHGTSEEKLTSDLWEAERLEFIVRSEGSYWFLHDRVQEAAYSQIPAELRPAAHLRIGRLLAARTLPENREEAIFEIVNQLNRGATLISSEEDREELSELNLIAGKRAKASTAYVSALTYLVAGAALLANDSWEQRHELTFALEFNRAECEFLTSALPEADQRLVELSNRAETTGERAAVACLWTDVCTTLGQTDRAVAVCLDYLRYAAGIDWTPHPTEEETLREYEHIWKTLGGRTIEDLIDLPLMDDAASLATMDVLTKLLPPAAYTDANLGCMTGCRAVSLSLERGNCAASCFAYSNFSRMTRPRFGDYEAGYRLGELGYELVERGGLRRFEASTYLCFGLFVLPWTKHVRLCRDLLQRALEIANRNGDLMWASYTSCELNSCRLFAGDPLAELQREAERGFTIAEKAGFGLCMDGTTTVLALSRTLRGLTPKFGGFDEPQHNELQFEHHISSQPHLTLVACRHWVRKLQARYLAGDWAAALDALSRAKQLLWTSTSFFEEAEYYFYGALLRAALSGSATPDGQEDLSSEASAKEELLKALGEDHKRLALWAEYCPENFENRAALVGAEIARIEGRTLDAMDLYEQAIRSAQTNGFVHNEALANELASRFYRTIGFEKIANTYLRDARYGYLRWGANGKVRQLDALYPHLKQEEQTAGLTTTIGTSVEHLDLATVIKVSQAVSGEIVWEKLIDTLMRIAIEHAGAERGLLILPEAIELRVEAEASTSGDTVKVDLREASTANAALAESIVHYVVRTQESVILDDASAQNPFSSDAYIGRHHARSILCLPLVNQAKLIAVLYLENNLAPHVFTSTRIAVLKLLASQAAICLENTRLYRGLEEREAKIRRLVDANIIGIFVWNLEGEIIEANEAFLQMLRFSREDLISGRVRWPDLTPAEWRDSDERAVAEIKATGTLHPFQKEYLRKDGSRIPVMIGGAMFEERKNEGVAFVLDLSQQRHAEDKRKRAEDALLEAQAELAHVTRVASLGELTASIAHEINQPLGAVVNNASACLRWLRADNLEEARQSASLAIAEGHRAGQIISRIRALAKKTPPHKDWLDINETIGEVIAMVRSGVQRNRISLQTGLANDLPLILGDRIQLQQVILNLLNNAIEAMSEMSEHPRELGVSSQRLTETAARGSRALQTCEPEEDVFATRTLTEAEATCVLITVRNSGPGLDSKSLDRLFDAFYTTKLQGLGMGLAISRSIIEAHGGRLWAKANVPQGAVFQFTLPLGEERMS